MDGVENRVGRKTEITKLLANLPRLGVGLAYREPFRDELLQKQSEVDFLEIAADDYLDATPVLEEELELLAEHFTIVPHFMKLSLGSAEGVDEDRARRLGALGRAQVAVPRRQCKAVVGTHGGAADDVHRAAQRQVEHPRVAARLKALLNECCENPRTAPLP